MMKINHTKQIIERNQKEKNKAKTNQKQTKNKPKTKQKTNAMPGLTTKKIRENNGYNHTVHRDIVLSAYINDWIMKDRIDFPLWQRDDCWSDEYRVKLIEAILQNHDLPKIFLSKQKGSSSEKFYLLDGGHRTRAISRFMNNEYGVMIDTDNVFYDKVTSGTDRNNRVMNGYEKKIFDSYKLTITIFDGLTEAESRSIFNSLQNAQPMSMADIVNSHESYLIDYLRSLAKFSIDDQHLSKYFDDYKKVLGQSGNSHMLYQLASWWTVCFPPQTNSKAESALAHALKGEKKDTSTCYKYVKNYDEEITDDQKEFFQAQLKRLIRQIFSLKDLKKNIGIAEATSILHANMYVDNFSMDKFIDIVDDLQQYTIQVKASKKHADTKNYVEQKTCDVAAQSLNQKYDFCLSEWKQLKSNLNENGMSKRYGMIKKYSVSLDTDSDGSAFENDSEALEVIS